MIVRIVKMTFQPEKTDAFLEIFKEVKGKINAFEGCRGVQLLRDRSQPNRMFTYSEWTDEQALENYRNSSFFKQTWQKTKLLFAAKPEAWSLEREG